MSWPASSSSVIAFNCSSAHLSASFEGWRRYDCLTSAPSVTTGGSSAFARKRAGGVTAGRAMTATASHTRAKSFNFDLILVLAISKRQCRLIRGVRRGQFVTPLGGRGREGEAREPGDEERDAAPEKHVPRPRE